MLPTESAETAARRVLAVETGIRDLSRLHLEQLRTYSEPDRDPRMRVVSVAFAALLPDPPEPHGGGDAAQARWLPYGSVGPLAFDHDRILADAHERVGAKLEYTCLATSFCQPEFTLGELQRIYETVWGAVLDRPNFRRKVLATPGFVAPVPGPHASPEAAANPPRSTARAAPPPCSHPCCVPFGRTALMTTTPTLAKHAASGSLLGLALGDALGFPTEFSDIPSILAKFGPGGR